MSRFDYLIEKINDAELTTNPFKHVYIEDLFTKEDFNEIIKCKEIATPRVASDKELITALYDRGYKVINFPGCVTDADEYIRWHSSKKETSQTHSACEGFGMVLRLYEKKAKILRELEEFLLSEEFNSTIANKFNISLNDCKIDGGIQKYLDGYEISPHPDIRKKAATYMVNINPSEASESADHHTHYLKFKSSKQYVSKFWEENLDYDRDWVPWDWCETVKQQTKNNSIVIFSPSNDTIHAVKANYNHLVTQRTQLYGNLWYLDSNAKKLSWEQLQIPNTIVPVSFRNSVKSHLPPRIKDILKKITRKTSANIGNTNMN